MFSWMFSPSPVVYETTPEERFMIVMRRLDAIEKAVENLRGAVLGEKVTPSNVSECDASEIEEEPGLDELDSESEEEV